MGAANRFEGGPVPVALLLGVALLATAGIAPVSTAETVDSEDHEDETFSDLRVDVLTNPEGPFVDEEVLIQGTLTNQRSTSIENVTARIAVDGTVEAEDAVGTVEPFAQADVSVQHPPLAGGEHDITVTAEGTVPADNGSTTRSSETEELLVTERNRSDLVPDELSVTPDTGDPPSPSGTGEIVEGERVRVTWTLANVGEGYPATSPGLLEADGEAVDRRDFGRLDPTGDEMGLAIRLSETVDGFAAGERTATITADPYEEEPELDETNNEMSSTFTVLEKANPAVVDITVERSHVTVLGQEGPPNPWAEREVTLTVANDGPGPTVQPAVMEASVCSEDGILTPAEDRCTHLGDWSISAMGTDAEREVVTEWNPEGNVGNYEICAHLAYERPQTQEADDEACKDTSVIVGNAGVGGR